MCGILFILIQNNGEDLNLINSGFKHLENRGPDRGTLSITKNYITGFQRLCINDLSTKGDQPFISENGNILACNGEIFNYRSIMDKHNIKCSSKSDCEVILHLFNIVGIKDTVKELNGDYAFYINTPDHVYMARDIVGVRPLFFGFTRNGNLCISSIAKGLLEFSDDVFEVKPGITCFDKKTGIISEIPRFMPVLENDNLVQILTKSVKDRLLSDRPIGCLLSGGLDSSLIASILCKLIGPQNVRTYSIGFKGSNDLINAEKVSKYLKTNHKSIEITESDIHYNLLSVIKDLESYDITTIRASVPMWLLAYYIKENTEDIVLFSGEGADELFCGYLYFHYAPNYDALLNERTRLFNEMYKYDCLRADRCISSHGLELRVPFLDKNVINYAFNLKPDLLCPKTNNNIEKFHLRKAFSNGYLPDEILWRRKDGFSDGVTSTESKPWYSDFQNQDYDRENYVSREAQVYKEFYYNIFKDFDLNYDYWMPKWIDTNGDPSGRKLKAFTN